MKAKKEQNKRPVEFAIVVTSYNNEYWCSKNLTSIANQTYPHFHLYYTDDASSDTTGELAEIFMLSPALRDRSTFIRNKERQRALANIYNMIHQIDPHKVIVSVDGDDWLAHDQVLERLASIYANPDIWLTYGGFDSELSSVQSTESPWTKEPYPQSVCDENSFRSYTFYGLHLKTFYAKLFQKIKKEDLMYENEFFRVTWDLAFMLPMLEMASNGHIYFTREVLYIYNVGNPISDARIYREEAAKAAKYIRSLTRYEKLPKLF
jgi:glycosyltransferase involved in cell wall biosynthesis